MTIQINEFKINVSNLLITICYKNAEELKDDCFVMPVELTKIIDFTRFINTFFFRP